MPSRRRKQDNPLLEPIRASFEIKRTKKTGIVPRNWLLIILCILDHVRESDHALEEDDIYTYDYTLKASRSIAIKKLLERYGLPKLDMSDEGVTVRGAAGLRVFRAIEGGGVIMDRSKSEREVLVLEAVELVREEVMRLLGQKPVNLPRHKFEHYGPFVDALIEAVRNRSQGRVEQALVGAKLQLRFRDSEIPVNPGYAGDRQTGRECDYEADEIRVIVSVSPKEQHFEAAMRLADAKREVFLVVSEKAFKAARERVRKAGYLGPVTVMNVSDYVTSNLKEIAKELKLSAQEMCLKLVAEYNRRIAYDRDQSLQVVLPD